MSEVTESDYRKPQSLMFPDDETKSLWLTRLLDAYVIIDLVLLVVFKIAQLLCHRVQSSHESFF